MERGGLAEGRVALVIGNADYRHARVPAVERGNLLAMAEFGLIHQNGQGVPQDYLTARGWYEKAAAKGNASAMTRLGVLHHNGLGVLQSYVIARGWYEKAAEKGESAAMRNLAILFSAGRVLRRARRPPPGICLPPPDWGA